MKDRPYFKRERFYVSPYNYSDAVTSQFHFNAGKKVEIIDLTLAKIHEMPGTRFSVSDKLELAKRLDDIGIHELSWPIPGLRISREESIETAKSIAAMKRKFKVSLIVEVRDGREVIDLCRRTHVDHLDIVTPAASWLLRSRTNYDEETGVRELCDLLRYARKVGLSVGAGLQETSKGTLEYISDTCNRAIEAGASRLMLADSLGSLSPFGMKFLVEQLKQRLYSPVPIIVHCHNSFGQATMNACAAVTGGAAGVHVAANGLGLHGGLSSLEETVVALEMLFGLSTGIAMEKLYEFCKYVEGATGVILPRHRPAVGDYNFVYETEADVLEVLAGKHVGELEKLSYPVARTFAPEAVGLHREIVWGNATLSGTALEKKLQRMNLRYKPEDINLILKELRKRLKAIKRYPVWISDSKVEDLCRSVVNSNKRRTSKARAVSSVP